MSLIKYVLVTGGVLSGIGKGVIASSTSRLMKSYGYNVTQIKIDPYLNVDAGTMSPFEHGEVFVLDDGGEVDLDLGNYERFVDITLTSDNNITTGKIYKTVIEKEREGKYLGSTVQVIPHVCNEIQDWVERVSKYPTNGIEDVPDICVIELGGTVGDIESMPFIEAMRQFQFRVGKENFCSIHVSLVPTVGSVGEQKTKPTQMSVAELRKLGLFPDIIACRSKDELSESTKSKISLFCHVNPENVIGVPDCGNLYYIPIMLNKQGYARQLLKCLKLNPENELNLVEWSNMVQKVDNINLKENIIKIAMVGKYTGLKDSYLSVIKSLEHASFYVNEKCEIEWIEASHLEEQSKIDTPEEYNKAWESLKSSHGILVPGGFGDRGTEGKILAAKYSRENNIPYLGICLGLQIAVIEFSRNILQLEGANSEEFDESTKYPVVVFMPEIDKSKYGGTMRLGKRETLFSSENSVIVKLYQHINGVDKSVFERHRHRYEVNPQYVPEIQEKGLRFVGQDETGNRQEIIELDNHCYYVGVQYHPEFKSRPNKPSPPFVGLLLASSGKLVDFMNNINNK